jgi:hypothetical protein
MPDMAPQLLCTSSNLPGCIAAHVDADIPGTTCQALNAGWAFISVPTQSIDLRGKLVVGFSTIEDAHCMPNFDQRLDDVPANELRAAQDENFHRANVDSTC